ncbi:MAG: hypothetical protein IT317_04450 [Anaerolineales bacterium]|nr:hypothetical protein [Anaerolineales bacterium]
MPARYPALYVLAALSILGGALLTGCSGNSSAPVELSMAPLHTMPMGVQQAPTAYQEAYQFAVANPDALADVPCTCGCDQFGHKSNYNCYVAGTAADGSIIYDMHALGCQICIDITHEVMRQRQQGPG